MPFTGAAGESNTVTTLSGNFKEVYVDLLEWLMPKSLRLQQDISFVAADKMPGNHYNQPVVLQHEHGFTYAAAGAGAFALQSPSAGLIANAQVVGAQMLLESIMDYESSARASTGGKRAFVQATQYLVENMWQSSRKRLEADLMYGQQGIGTVLTVTDVANSVITVATPEWAPGLWAGMEGATLEFFNPGLTIENSANQTVKILSVDLVNRTITVDSNVVTTGAPDVIIGDRIFYNNQVVATPTHNCMAGLHTILANTGALFGINATTYSLWRSNSVAAGGINLSFETLQRAVALAAGKGAESELTLYINPLTWATLLTDQAALRRHTDPNKSARYIIGSEAIEFFSLVGKITVKASIYCKEGYAYLISPPLFHRVGATDITFRLPDRKDEFFQHLASFAGYGLRCYSNQALFSEAPGKATLITGIDNS